MGGNFLQYTGEVHDEVVERLWKIQTILQYRISPDHSNAMVHVGASPLIFYRVQVREMGWPWQNLCSVSHLCVDFHVCFGLFKLWIQLWPIIRFLAEAVRFFYLLAVDRIYNAMYLIKIPRTSSRKDCNIKDPSHVCQKALFIFIWP